jgi:diguanylate cyclase (GGDEF)-like protein/PAS domain S-box-containing protein
MPRTWTEAELSTAVAARDVSLCEPTGGDLPVPAWLVERSAGLFPYDSVTGMEAVHPANRVAVLDGFLAGLAAPGEPQVVRCPIRIEGSWRHVLLTMVDLSGDERVGGVLLTYEYVEGGPVEEVEAGDGGEGTATLWMVMTMDATSTICSVEGKPRELLGYEASEMLSRAPGSFMRPESIASVLQVWIALHAEPEGSQTSIRPWIRKDGSEVWLETSYVHRGEVPAGEGPVFVVSFDITERRAKEAALRQREDELHILAADLQQSLDVFRLLAEEVPTPVFRCDERAMVTFGNARWDELVGSRTGVERMHDLLSEPAGAALTAALEELGATSEPGPRSLEVDSDDGETVWRLWLRPVDGRAGGRRSYMGSLEDVTAHARLRREASSDTLTGLANRAAIDEELEATVAHQATDTVVVFIDLDGFKPVNDTHGHDAGDVVLIEVGRRLQLAVRPADTVGRYGGDEFVVLCRSVPDEVSDRMLTERLELALGGWIDLGHGREWPVAASLGAARPQPGDDAVTLLRRADRAMYEAKRVRCARR